ncbi:30S ribosomal protein S20 [Candidatus Poriferisodalis sp.]|uniref:30S ribosomal protein S20 n=1 Tax=Candidatus Poriferisodalis sp. TaxID=3101277 RepID=UPI003B018A3D
MANIKSQIKRNRQNETRRLRNRAVRSELRTREKAVVQAAEAGEPTDDLIRLAQARLDKAVSKGVIHRNEAGRRKSRLTVHSATRGANES